MSILSQFSRSSRYESDGERDVFGRWLRGGLVAAGVVCMVGILACVIYGGCSGSTAEGNKKKKRDKSAEGVEEKATAGSEFVPRADLHKPVREAPAHFPPDSNMPRGREIYASGPIELESFDPERDLTRFEDKRVWYESDHKKSSPDDDDHVIHKAMVEPLTRLVNLLEQRGGKLRIHDAFRAADKNKIHMANSLHCEGRAIDLTCENFDLGELAKLAWQSGFDFVLYEKPRNSGLHLHCSVKRSPEAELPPRP